MIARVTDDKTSLKIEFQSQMEIDQLLYTYTKKIRNYHFKVKNKKSKEGIYCYIDQFNNFPIGLWKDLMIFCKKYNFHIELYGINNVYNKNKITYEETQKFVEFLLSGSTYHVKPDQVEALYQSIVYKYFVFDLSVSLGKTMLCYLISCFNKVYYHKSGIKIKFLILTIKPELVIQMYKDFVSYSKKKNVIKFAMIHGDEHNDELEEFDVIISNFQYLQNKPDSFFSQFNGILLDEAHRITAPNIKRVVRLISPNALCKGGMSGSIIKDDTADYYNLLANFGPIVKTVKKRDLIEKGEATDGKVEVFQISYMKEEDRRKLIDYKLTMGGDKALAYEMAMIRSYEIRLIWIAKLASHFDNKNIVIYFKNSHSGAKNGDKPVKDSLGYGSKIVDYIKRHSTNKSVFYIDENVSQKNRDYFKDYMENNTNCILVATWDCWSTGQNVKNLHAIICGESIKDEVTLSQAMGRPMRLHDSKEKFLWIDIVDDCSIDVHDPIKGHYKYDNYMLKWLPLRKAYYSSEQFEYRLHKIDLINSKQQNNLF